MLAADYPFLDVLWTMLIFFLWIIWFWILITVFVDLFRRKDTSGVSKVLWIIFVILVPFLGVFIYLLVNHDGMSVKMRTAAGLWVAVCDAIARRNRAPISSITAAGSSQR